MNTSTAHIALIREDVNSLRVGLHLDTYLFEIEPRDYAWEIKVEYAIQQDYSSVSILLGVTHYRRNTIMNV